MHKTTPPDGGVVLGGRRYLLINERGFGGVAASAA